LSITIRTGRGLYAIKVAAAERSSDSLILTIALDRADGIERVAFRCRIATALAGNASDEAVAERLAPWIECDFEMTRETALKTIRSERHLHDFIFDANNRGPL
jgi:hypothetical protein